MEKAVLHTAAKVNQEKPDQIAIACMGEKSNTRVETQNFASLPWCQD
mgnify:CR=1 FL=1